MMAENNKALQELNQEFIDNKMKESTFDTPEERNMYKDYDYFIEGTRDAFIIYYTIKNVIWVHFLWNDKSFSGKKKMLKLCKELWQISVDEDRVVLFDCDTPEWFNNHCIPVYVWTEEI